MRQKKSVALATLCGLWTSLSLHADVLPLERQREIYRKAEALLPLSGEKNNFTVVDQLIDRLDGYVLLPYLQYQRLVSDKENLSADKIRQFAQHYPALAISNNLDRTLYQTLQQRADWQGILQLSQTPPSDLISRCVYFSAQAESQGDKTALWQAVDKIWLNGSSLPSACDDIFTRWQHAGRLSDDLLKQRAVLAFEKGSDGLLRHLRNQSHDIVMSNWLESLLELRNNPQSLSLFVQTAALNPQNADIVRLTFARYLRSLTEQQFAVPDPFAEYQAWGLRFGLDQAALNEWRAALISKLFDSENPSIRQWRDQQLRLLKQDNLTERRIRLAILAQSDLSEWLALLSDTGKAQQEWRFWQAFNDNKQGRKIQEQQQWQRLAQERGFYPMLAAEQLNSAYKPHFARLAQAEADAQLQPLRQNLAQIEEFLAIDQFAQAKQAWQALLAQADSKQQIALADYANQKQWYAFGVQATIQAKAWTYLAQRLPLAYPLWFEINLKDKWVPNSFAMAIARQESAWDVNAQSHADARGLMQLLPATAKATAEKFRLPYRHERQLFDAFDNIMLGTQHLQELADRFGENRIFIAAAYNAGSSRVERWSARAGGRLSMAEFIATIPFYETRGYVQNVLTFDYYYRMLSNQPLIKFAKSETDRLY
ncbi:transglycosylase SLT domain-containing protein [Chelonobacter oris]|uniref:transglycosylase SLT domain-containing protein n=1 Tax=Chelonobacter oris TaxID=505317 RepID=UPI00068E4C6D|nr:transglycosylase SLT domain-containing protein [Chelonobacter oris]